MLRLEVGLLLLFLKRVKVLKFLNDLIKNEVE